MSDSTAKLWRVAEAARLLLNELVDADEHRPDEENAEPCQPRDRDGLPWYPDAARLRVAMDELVHEVPDDLTFPPETHARLIESI